MMDEIAHDMARIVSHANVDECLQQNPMRFLAESGFRPYNSDGIQVFRKDYPTLNQYLLVYDNEGDGVPHTFADIEMCGYSADGASIEMPIDIDGHQVSGN